MTFGESYHLGGRLMPVRPFDSQMKCGLSSIRVSNRDSKNAKTDVLQGTLDLMVLQTLAVLGRLHGYAIATRIEQVSDGAIQLNMGTLYPALARLERRGLIRAKRSPPQQNAPPALSDARPPGPAR